MCQAVLLLYYVEGMRAIEVGICLQIQQEAEKRWEIRFTVFCVICAANNSDFACDLFTV